MGDMKEGDGGDGNGPPSGSLATTAAVEVVADFSAVYAAMMEELGDARMDSLPLADNQSTRGLTGRGGRGRLSSRGGFGRGASGRGDFHGNQTTTDMAMVDNVDKGRQHNAWHNFASEQDVKGLLPEANGQLARIRKVEQAKSIDVSQKPLLNTGYSQETLDEIKAMNAGYNLSRSNSHGPSRGRGRGSSRAGHSSILVRGGRYSREVDRQTASGSTKTFKAKEAMKRIAGYPKNDPRPLNPRNTRTSITSIPRVTPVVKLATPDEFLRSSGFARSNGIKPTTSAPGPKIGAGLKSSIYASSPADATASYESSTSQSDLRTTSAAAIVNNPLPAIVQPSNVATNASISGGPSGHKALITSVAKQTIKLETLAQFLVKVMKNDQFIDGKVGDLKILSDGSQHVKLIVESLHPPSEVLTEIIDNPALFQLNGAFVKLIPASDTNFTWQFIFQAPFYAKKAKDAVDDPKGFRSKQMFLLCSASELTNDDVFNPPAGPNRTQSWHDMNDISNGKPLIPIDDNNEDVPPSDHANKIGSDIMQDMVALMVTKELTDKIFASITAEYPVGFLGQVQLLVNLDPEAHSNPELAAKFNRVLEDGLHSSMYANGNSVVSSKPYAATAAIVMHHIDSMETMREFAAMHPSFITQLTQAVYEKIQNSTGASTIQDIATLGNVAPNAGSSTVSDAGQDSSIVRDREVTHAAGQMDHSIMKGSASSNTLSPVLEDPQDLANTQNSFDGRRIQYTREILLALRPTVEHDAPIPKVDTYTTQLGPAECSTKKDTFPHIDTSDHWNKPTDVGFIDTVTTVLACSKISDNSNSIEASRDPAAKDFESLMKLNGGLGSSRFASEGSLPPRFDGRRMLQKAGELLSSGSHPDSNISGQSQKPAKQDRAILPDVNGDLADTSFKAQSQPGRNLVSFENSKPIHACEQDAAPVSTESSLPMTVGLKASRWANALDSPVPERALVDHTKPHASIMNSITSAQSNPRVVYHSGQSVYLPARSSHPSSQSHVTPGALRKIWVDDGCGNLVEKLGTIVDEVCHSTPPQAAIDRQENIPLPQPTDDGLKGLSQNKISSSVQEALQSRLDKSLDGRRSSLR